MHSLHCVWDLFASYQTNDWNELAPYQVRQGEEKYTKSGISNRRIFKANDK